MKLREWLLSAASVALVFAAAPAGAQDDKKEGKDDDKKKTKTIESKVKDFEKIDGLFELYRDPKSGELYMEISEDQLSKDFIAFSYTENGVVDAGHFRGAYRDQRVLGFEKYYDRLEVVEKSTVFYFDPESPLARASDANISDGVIAALDIEAETPATGDDGFARYLIKANPLFLSEDLHKVSPTPGPGAEPDAFSVGPLAKDRTKYDDIRNYPQNTDIIVDYVFENKSPRNGGSDAVTDARSVTIKVQHSLIEMPDDGFTPRIDDFRVGYFFDKVTDLTSPDAANYRDMINRWRLVKKDPEAEISDPVTPITWWIENTTPVEWRDTIRDAVLAWNQSFEKAGFSNAVEVKIQPDDAEWDAGDIRYNVLRWTSSPNPPFGGYGPSFTNPRTGEIIGADIMLEHVFVTNRQDISEIFSTAISHADGIDHARIGKGIRCSAGHELHMSRLFGAMALQATGASDTDLKEITRQGLYYLMLHEVGHTLGLNHNMKASSVFGPREVHDKSVTQGAPTGSVMDYPAVNIAPKGVAQGDFYMLRPGPYDDWAIEFGYHPVLDDPTAEEARVDALLARAGETPLLFGNDADDMRAPGSGIDPRVMIGDMSSDPVAYGIDRIELVNATMPVLLEKFGKRDSWQDLVQAFAIARGQHGTMATVMSRQIGGVYVDRLDPADGKPAYRPVPRERQKNAMDALSKYVFAGDAFEISPELAARLQVQRRGFNFFGNNEDPKLHDQALGIQMGVLAHLLHPNVMQRMIDYKTYGGNYAPLEMIKDLNEAIFGGDLLGAPNDYRRNLQIAYTERLVSIIENPSYSPAARAAALAGTDNLKGRLGFIDLHLPGEAKAHRRHLLRLMKDV